MEDFRALHQATTIQLHGLRPLRSPLHGFDFKAYCGGKPRPNRVRSCHVDNGRLQRSKGARDLSWAVTQVPRLAPPLGDSF
jgi:hypothetical protein